MPVPRPGSGDRDQAALLLFDSEPPLEPPVDVPEDPDEPDDDFVSELDDLPPESEEFPEPPEGFFDEL